MHCKFEVVYYKIWIKTKIFFPEESSFLFLEDQPSKKRLLKHCIFGSNIISKSFSESNLCDTKILNKLCCWCWVQRVVLHQIPAWKYFDVEFQHSAEETHQLRVMVFKDYHITQNKFSRKKTCISAYQFTKCFNIS